MINISTNEVVIARYAGALYDVALDKNTADAVEAAIAASSPATGVNDFLNQIYVRDFGAQATDVVAATIAQNIGLTPPLSDYAATYITGLLNAAAPEARGAVVANVLNLFATFTDNADPAWAAAATAWEHQVTAAVAYSNNAANTVLAPLPLPTLDGKSFNLVSIDVPAGPGLPDFQAMRLTGDQDVRIDFTNPANQIKGLDLNGNGVIANDGVENNITGRAANFEIVDAYARNPLNQFDISQNFLGDIRYDGTGFAGDGVSTNGNLVLGGLGADTVLGGIGNDFLAGGGVAAANPGIDNLQGGRNADFFFAELSLLDQTDGNSLSINGGSTSDDAAVGNNTPQDADWLLIEASDDEDGTVIQLAVEGSQSVVTGAGQSIVGMSEIEHVDASGNLYGFLDDYNNVALGGGGHLTAAGENVGIGASAQLHIIGSVANNILIGGYDNDLIEGGDGSDLLMGGNLNYAFNNPNAQGITNNGMDELYGNDGADNLAWEADSGIYEGHTDLDVDDEAPADADMANNDTLWLTREALGTKTTAQLTTDGVLRLDLGVGKEGGLANYSGYGGADQDSSLNYTADQTNYVAGVARTTTADMENVIATGLGAVDYRAAGSNNPDLAFKNQQNHFAYNGDLDLRGTMGANTLYAAAGSDVVEGREGNDLLSGGEGNDDFIFELAGGEGVDVIHRQTDVGNNLTDGTFGRDFGLGGSSTTGPSTLSVDFAAANLASSNVWMSSFSVVIGGVTFAVIDMAALAAVDNVADLATLANTRFQTIDSNVTVTAAGNVLTITDATPTGGRDISDTQAEGYAVSTSVTAPGTSTLGLPVFTAPGQAVAEDRLIYAAYEDRADGELVDDDSFVGSTISLGDHNYAQDLVVDFAADGTRIAESQAYTVTFNNLTTQDKVTLAVNGVNYSLQVGVDLDGNIQANEDGIGETQAAIQANFLARFTAFINSFNDTNTAAGEISAALAGSTITITQVNYNGEETVFMKTPVVTLQNLSNGQPPTAVVANVSSHEVHLLNFDGRNAELNAQNVLFIGDKGVSRAVFATASDAGGALNGSDVVVIDGGANNLVDVATGSSLIAVNNTATNGALATNFTAHGDDLLIGGIGNDTITAGTGDDRVIGSIGNDTADGGKNVYSVQVLGEAKARVYVLNVWEAASVANLKTVLPELAAATITSITNIAQTETGFGLTTGIYQDTLQFQQADIGANARFTVVLDGFSTTGAALASNVEFRNGGAGHVLTDADGNGATESTTAFTNFENIRTVSGTGAADASQGQGRDTLDVSALSSVAATGGVSYNLTNDGGNGEVRYSENATSAVPVAGDYEALAIRVDGVESVLAGLGNDLLLIDETEANKDNTFQAGLGVDRVIYSNQYDGVFAIDTLAQPSMTLNLLGAGNLDVTSTAGRNGTTVATDTLRGVERVSLTLGTAEGSRENDVLDVTAYAGGVVVDYTNGQVRTDIVPDVGVQVTIDGIARIENVWGDGSNDTVVVASSGAMSGANATSDGLADQKDISFAHFRDFDTLDANNDRVAFQDQDSADRANMINEGQYTFDLSHVGGGNDVDTVDYSNATDDIAVVVRPESEINQYVIVETVTFGDEVVDLNDRVDVLLDIEQVVASQGESVLDFTGSSNVEIKFSSPNPLLQVAALDRAVSSVQIADLTSAVPLNRGFLEYRDAGLSAVVTQATATWNRIEGGDLGERVILASVQSTEDVVMNLRGGANTVKYNELSRSITSTLSAEAFDAADPLNSGVITLVTTFQDGDGLPLPGSGTHRATSYTVDNGIAAGTLRVAASQDAEDTLEVAGLDGKLFLLAEQGTTDNQISVKLGSGAAANTVVLTGYEFLQDAASDDAYDMGSLSSVLAGLTLTDNVADDHDAIVVRNDAINFNAAGANTISLVALNNAVGGFNFDFDVLDVTKVTNSNLILVGTAGVTDEVVLGALSKVASINAFESVVLTDATVVAGNTFTLNSATGVLSQGSTNVTIGTNIVSFGGLVLEQDGVYGNSYVDDVATAVSVTVTGGAAAEVHGGAGGDTLVGGGGSETLRGGAGNDTLDGGIGTEVREMNVQGILDVAAGGSVSLTFNGFVGATVTEGAEIVVGAGNDAVGRALAAAVNANIAAINVGAAWTAGALTGAAYDTGTDLLTFTFAPGVDVLNAETIVGAVAGDAGTLALSAETVVSEGSDGAANVFLFEETGTGNGVDTILNFKNAATDDVLDFTAFLGAAAVYDGDQDEDAAFEVMTLTGGENVGLFYNSAALTTSRVELNGSATIVNGDVVIDNDAKAVVLVTADVDGFADATNQPYSVYFVEDTDQGAGFTAQVTLVGTINSVSELNAFDFSGANFA